MQNKQAALINNAKNYKSAGASTQSQLIMRSIFELKQVIFSAPFMILAGVSIVTLMIPLFAPIGAYGTTNWPITANMVNIISGISGLFLFVIIAFYSAELSAIKSDNNKQKQTRNTANNIDHIRGNWPVSCTVSANGSKQRDHKRYNTYTR